MDSAVNTDRNPMVPGSRRGQADGTACGRAAALVLCALAGLPNAVLADAPVADPVAHVTPVVGAAEPASATGSGPARDSAGDWDGLVTLVVSYLEATSDATVTSDLAEPAT
jgi:hypothetical protein